MNSPHQVKVVIRKQQRHQLALFHAHTMLASQRAANFHAIANNLGGSLNRSLILTRIAGIKQNNGMQIPIAGVKNVANLEIISFPDFLDATQGLRNFRSWYPTVQHVITRRDSAEHAKGVLAPFPK